MKMMIKILLAEDTRDLNRALTAVLERNEFEVDAVYDGEAASEMLGTESYDMIILDIMMPKKDGLEVLRDLRAQNILTPVLLLTARAEVDDRVTGLDAGADDYLTKPFAMQELLARVRALTRRHSAYSGEELVYADIRLNADRFELSSQNSVRLSIREFELMKTLMMNVGHELDTEYLLDHVWEHDPEANPEAVWLYISYLKGKLIAVNSRTVISGERGGSFCLEEGLS